MGLDALLSDDIGTVFTVALVVLDIIVLAAVVATFVFGLGARV